LNRFWVAGCDSLGCHSFFRLFCLPIVFWKNYNIGNLFTISIKISIESGAIWWEVPTKNYFNNFIIDGALDH
jgi:hypothetical protein